ncbi:MAG: AAA family ATPase [Zavarzinella sp.]|nr:AAA family ATPase [Zavarzinella sp.]
MHLADLRSADQIAPVAVPWLWPGWLPAGKLVVLDGAPEVGKSTLMSDLAAKLSRGHFGGEPAATLFVTVEESAGDSIVPRLVAAGADLARVHVWRAGDDFRLPDRIDQLREAICHTGAKLVVLDPLSDFLGVAMSDEQSVRRALRALGRLAEETGCTTLLIRHLCKHAVGAAMYRGLGSVGILAAARVVWLLGHHPRGEGRRILTVVKSNLAERPAAKVFRFVDRRVEWVTEEDWWAPEDVRPVGEPSQAAWLRSQLARGPKKSKRLMAEAQVLGMSVRTLQRAKQALQIVSRRYYGSWYWCLPGQDPWERYGSLEPLDDKDPMTNSVLEPMDNPLGPVEDDCRMRVREGMTERQRLREATRVLRADERAERGPRRASRREPDVDSPVVGERCPAADLSPPTPEAKGGRKARAREAENEGPPPAAGSRRFDPAPAGSLDVVLRLGDANADWSATVIDRLYRFDELVKCRAGDAARLLWEPAWTGPVGDGRLRLVLSPRDFPPDRLASLGAWAEESLAHCESARLAA